MPCTFGRTQSSKKAWSEEEEQELCRLYQEFTNKTGLEDGNSGEGDYTHKHTQTNKHIPTG